MSVKHLKIAAAALAVAALLASCGERTPDYEYHIDMENYQNAINSREEAHLILANKQHPLGEGYAPADLRTIPTELTLYGKGETPPPASVAEVARFTLVCASGMYHGQYASNASEEKLETD